MSNTFMLGIVMDLPFKKHFHIQGHIEEDGYDIIKDWLLDSGDVLATPSYLAPNDPNKTHQEARMSFLEDYSALHGYRP